MISTVIDTGDWRKVLEWGSSGVSEEKVRGGEENKLKEVMKVI